MLARVKPLMSKIKHCLIHCQHGEWRASQMARNTYSSLDRRAQGEAGGLDNVDNEPLESLDLFGKGLVQSNANAGDGSAEPVGAVDVALADAKLLHEVLGNGLVVGVGAGLVFDHLGVAVPHNVGLELEGVAAPVHGEDHHDEGGVDVPLARAQEAQDEHVGVVGLDGLDDHGAHRLAVVLGQHLDKLLAVGLLAGVGGGRHVQVLFDDIFGLGAGAAEEAEARLGRVDLVRGALDGSLQLGVVALVEVVELEDGAPELLELGLVLLGEVSNVAFGHGVCHIV